MQAIFSGVDPWLTFAHRAWQAAGSPSNLDPNAVLTNPVVYNQATYLWIERRYREIYRKLFQSISPDGPLIQRQPDHFIRCWRVYYDPVTIWKQVCPLFIFGETLGGLDLRHLRLAVAYALGYGIPVMAIDQMLDVLPNTPHDVQDWLFVLSAYALGLEQIQAANVPALIVTRFLEYTRQMHHFFWREKQSHFRLPAPVTSAHLRAYLHGNSRLLSSIFFSTTIEWAFILHQGSLPKQCAPLLPSLRRLRQLNDELVDIDDDIRYGIVTYPYLHGLASKQYGSALAQNIYQTWELDAADPASTQMVALTSQRRELLQQAGSFEATAIASMSLLRTAMKLIMNYFTPTQAFGITLLLNQRLSHLVRLAQNNWQEITNIYQPNPAGSAVLDVVPVQGYPSQLKLFDTAHLQ